MSISLQLRSKLMSGGGVDVGQYAQSCTHLIVDKLVYVSLISISTLCSAFKVLIFFFFFLSLG